MRSGLFHLILIVFTVGALTSSCLEKEQKDLLDLELISSQMRLLLSEVENAVFTGNTDGADTTQKINYNPKLFPRSIMNGELHLVPSEDWTSGFFPGNLWYLYELTGDDFWRQKARVFTVLLQQEKFNGTTHDMGFKMYCSFGNGYRIDKNLNYKEVMIEAANTLMTRYKKSVGAIKSWDTMPDGKWMFPVIIDNMMNLELLFWAAKATGDQSFRQVAVQHALTTLRNHFRDDHSCFHVVDYDTITGDVRIKQTHQGAADESAWARGQAWALYGYTMCYRETKNTEFLKQAERVAEYILKHPNLPSDLVPYWDFDAPGIPNQPRDVSAAAVISSALFELSKFTHSTYKSLYYSRLANEILYNLSTYYMSAPGTNFGFILDHSTGHYPKMQEIDVPLVYADYYYLEAILRKRNLELGEKTEDINSPFEID